MKTHVSPSPTALASPTGAAHRRLLAAGTPLHSSWGLLLGSLGLLLARPVAAQPVTAFEFTQQNGTVTITKYTGRSTSHVVIPPVLGGLPVVEIGPGAFQIHPEIVRLTLPDSIIRIGDRAFHSLIGLTLVRMSDSVVSIGEHAFDFCQALRSVTLPVSVTNIGFGAFRHTGLTSVTIPGGVTGIGLYAFSGCTNLASLAVDPQNPAYSSRDGVLFDRGQTLLIQYPPAARAATYTIPATVTRIERSAFLFSSWLTGVALLEGITDVGTFAFLHCRGLKEITIPRSVTSIGIAPFGFCTNLVSIHVAPGNAAYSSHDGVLFNHPGTELLEYPAGRPAESYAIPGTVTAIGWNALEGSQHLVNVTIPPGVTSMGGDAFRACPRLVGAYFQGDAPEIMDTRWLIAFGEPTVAYYLPGTKGWGPDFGGVPAAPWVLPNPVILSAGILSTPPANGFGFTISWAVDSGVVVVEATTNLIPPTWTPISTNTIRYAATSTDPLNGTAAFRDPHWKNTASRFYRLGSR